MDRVTFENTNQDSEYDSRSDEVERESAEDQKEDSLDLIAIIFLLLGRVISLSHRATIRLGIRYTLLQRYHRNIQQMVSRNWFNSSPD